MAEKISTPGRRFMKLAGMTASIAGKAVSNSIKSINSTEEEKVAMISSEEREWKFIL